PEKLNDVVLAAPRDKLPVFKYLPANRYPPVTVTSPTVPLPPSEPTLPPEFITVTGPGRLPLTLTPPPEANVGPANVLALVRMFWPLPPEKVRLPVPVKGPDMVLVGNGTKRALPTMVRAWPLRLTGPESK